MAYIKIIQPHEAQGLLKDVYENLEGKTKNFCGQYT